VTPETQYARAGDAHIAYQVLGDGPIDIVLADQWFSHMEAQWDVPPMAQFRERLASFSRLIMFDKRGIGMSDPVPINQLPVLEEVDRRPESRHGRGWFRAGQPGDQHRRRLDGDRMRRVIPGSRLIACDR
jgi:hypothetical protein